jgi:outer membrane protein, heavy metal efflux system
MSTPRWPMIVPLLISLTSCATTPSAPDRSRVSAAVTEASAGKPRLPALTTGELDPNYFNDVLTVDRAVQAALLNNPEVGVELLRLDVAQAEKVQAGLLRNPMASMMALRPDGGGRFEIDYGLMQSMFDLFTRSRRVAVAEAGQRRIEAEVIGNLVDLAQQTKAAYYDALVASETLRLLQAQASIDEDGLRLLQRQAMQGGSSVSTVLSQQAARSMQGHEVQVAEATVAQARTALATRLGLRSSLGMKLPDELPLFVMPGLDNPQLQAFAATHRPDLLAATSAIEQAQRERLGQRGALRNTELALGPSGVRESDGMSLNGVGVQLLLPIFDTGRARRDMATAQVGQAQFSEQALRRRVPLDVEQAVFGLLIAEKAAAHASHHVDQQRALERLARRNYQQGVADRPSYLQARRERLSSQLQQLQSQQALWSALSTLERALGVASLPGS